MDYKLIGKRIREARKAKGITQKELGTEISRTESSIAKYEQGLVEIPNSVLQSIASALGVSVDYFFGKNSDSNVKVGDTYFDGRATITDVHTDGGKLHITLDLDENSVSDREKGLIVAALEQLSTASGMSMEDILKLAEDAVRHVIDGKK